MNRFDIYNFLGISSLATRSSTISYYNENDLAGQVFLIGMLEPPTIL